MLCTLTVQLLRYWDKFYFASAGRARARAKYWCQINQVHIALANILDQNTKHSVFTQTLVASSKSSALVTSRTFHVRIHGVYSVINEFINLH